MATAGHDAAGGLRGSKASSWEGGHRQPFIAKWPGQITADRVTDALINCTDIFATLAELLEVDPAKAYPQSAADSVSFLSVLLDPDRTYERPGVMVTRSSIRQGDWKLVPRKKLKNLNHLEASKFGLYKLADDLGEQNDLSRAHPERARRLLNELKKFAAARKLK